MDLNQIYTFNFPTIIRFGKGAILELGKHLLENNCRRPLIVGDRGICELDFFLKILESLRLDNLTAATFNEISKNPVKSDVEKGVRFYQENDCDSIVGIGGGASMDVARAIALGVNHNQDLFSYEEAIGGDKKITEKIPYFVTVPTTSGTGSEVGRSSVISDDETHQKKILFHPSLLAKIVFADPELTMNLPKEITAATGMDALTHNIEAFLARGFNPLCDGIALEGIRLTGKALSRAVNAPDLESRSMMMAAALMGAVAFQKGLGVVHSCAHSLSTNLDLHHGLANAIMLPYCLDFNFDHCESKFNTIASALTGKDVDGKELVNIIKDLNSQVGIDSRLGSYNTNESDIEKLSEVAFADACHPCNPKSVTFEDFRKIFTKAL